MTIMESRYAGTCRDCGARFPAGSAIRYYRNAGRGKKAAHLNCSDPDERVQGEGADIHTFRTSGGTFTRNARGMCEDAPCCGCCTI